MTDYPENFILANFSTEQGLKVSQLIHILNGKRTPSVFYMTVRKNLCSVYGLFPYLKRNQLKLIVDRLKKDEKLCEHDDGLYLTSKGRKEIQKFKEEYYYPHFIDSFKYTMLRNPLWQHIQLFSQIASYWSYQEQQFTPLIRDEKVQENVREILSRYRDEFKDNWVAEQYAIFSACQSSEADFLIRGLSGFRSWGDTFVEMSADQKGGPWETHLKQQDFIDHYIQLAQELNLTFHQRIIDWVFQTYSAGLSPSTYQSIQMISQGFSLRQIASMRHLKLNTIREHVLEAAFVHPQYSYSRLIDERTYQSLQQLFQDNEQLRYRDAKEHLPDLVFMDFRLVEMERWWDDV